MINGMFYIGKHETDNINDGYIGSGIKLKRAISEFGKINFSRRIIYELKTREEMNLKEAEIVNEKFLKRNDVYNINIGGNGWNSFINTKEVNDKRRETMSKKGDYYKRCSLIGNQKLAKLRKDKEYCSKLRDRIRESMRRRLELNPDSCKTFAGRTHTDETKRKMSLRKKGKPFPTNASIGMMWIKNDTLKANDRIQRTQDIPEGWTIGRCMSYSMYSNICRTKSKS